MQNKRVRLTSPAHPAIPAPPRMKSRPWLAISALLMLVAAGAITWQQWRGGTEPVAPPVRPAYEAQLQLAAGDLEALRPIVSSTAADMTRFRREMRSQLSSTVRDLNAAIERDLHRAPALPAEGSPARASP